MSTTKQIGFHGVPRRREAMVAALFGAGTLRAAPEARVRVFSTTDRPLVQPLIDDFERRHGGTRVDYVQLGSTELFERFIREGGRTADVLWSSAMDLQIKLVNDGYAARHESPHAPRLPRWAVWKHEAYGVTVEPVGWAYHGQLLGPAEVPRTHAALTALLQADPQRFRERVATYDIERAGLGYLIAAHDSMASPRSWDLVRALGACRVSRHTETHSMLDSVAAGSSVLAYNVLGTYAEAFARTRPEVAVAYPDDYTLVASRVAFIARHAPNPRGARQWLDHLLSPHGQRVLSEQCGLYSALADDGQPTSADSLGRRLGRAARPIALGPGLLAHLDQSKRQAFLKRWNEAAWPR